MYTCYIAWILYSLTSSISRNGIAKSKCMCICNLISISKLSSLEFALIYPVTSNVQECLLSPTLHQHNVLSIFLFFKINFYWNILDLQCCINFCYTAKWISYLYTFIHQCTLSQAMYKSVCFLLPSLAQCFIKVFDFWQDYLKSHFAIQEKLSTTLQINCTSVE